MNEQGQVYYRILYEVRDHNIGTTKWIVHKSQHANNELLTTPAAVKGLVKQYQNKATYFGNRYYTGEVKVQRAVLNPWEVIDVRDLA